ncbi:hypothetical protein O5623_28760 [Escherichia coli]|nr:hypothetical protein [Escherichia coli]
MVLLIFAHLKMLSTPEGINTAAIVVSNGGMATNKGTINITADASTNNNNGKTRGVNVGAGGSFY